MSDMIDDIPANWREDPLEDSPPVRTRNFLRERGYEDPDETRIKFLLVGRLRDIVEAKHLRQTDLVRLFNVNNPSSKMTQPDISRILRGNVKGFSTWRLMRLLNSAGDDVRLVTSPSDNEHATIDVVNKDHFIHAGV
jgi:predicted XRE-type DNA-binding protein